MADEYSIRQENESLRNYTLDIFVGRKIGSGSYRNVYALNLDHTKVVKVEHSGRQFCNIHEWQVWLEVKDTPISHWFAPCHGIDVMGIALLQSRTKPFDSAAEFEAEVAKLPGGKLPPFLDDIHYGNFGMLNGRLVCHDYGFTHFLNHGVEKNWRNEQSKEKRRKSGKKKA